MRQTLVIARRELAEKRFVFFAAIAFAALPFVLALVPGTRNLGSSARDVIVAAAAIIGSGFAVAVALALGANVIGRDLAENRLAFYFSRPVGAASIWFGKVAAALVLIVVCLATILLPARLIGGVRWRSTWGSSEMALMAIVLGVAIAAFFVAHVIGSFVRSRSAWIAADFAAFAAAGVAAYLILRPVLDAGAVGATRWLATGMGCGVAVALVGGGAWQLARGRTDRTRSHLALSQFVWTVIGATLAIAAAFVAWLTSATPNDLVHLTAFMPRSGAWILIGGEARWRLDYRSVFAYNVDRRAYSRIAAGGLWRVDFTPDGKTLVIGRGDRGAQTMRIAERSVDRDDERPTDLTVHLIADYVPSATGDRIAVVDGGILNVYDVAQKRSLASARLPADAGDVAVMYFASPAVLRVFTTTKSSVRPRPLHLRLFEFDAANRALRQTGELLRDARALIVSANEDGSRLLVRDGDARYLVLDGRTAAVQATLDTPDAGAATFLRDGGIAVLAHRGARNEIAIFDRGGAELRRIPLPFETSWFVRALRDGGLLVPTRSSGEWQTLIVDPATGASLRIPAMPLYAANWYARDPRRGPIDRPTIFFQGDHLIRWNYAARKGDVILPR